MNTTEKVKEILIDEVTNAWLANGHDLTGEAIKTIKFVVDEQKVDMFINNYAVFQSTGVKANKIPYSGRSGRGGTSLYIQGLIRYVKLRMGKDEKEAKPIAFAIANKHKQVGMQIRTRGQGTKWIAEADEKINPRLSKLFDNEFRNFIREKANEIETN